MASNETATPNTRGEQRIPMQMTLNVIGINDRGQVFNEQAVTHNVSRHGICFTLPDRVSPGQFINVNVQHSRVVSTPSTFQIRWAASQSGRSTVGAYLVKGHWESLLAEAGALDH